MQFRTIVETHHLYGWIGRLYAVDQHGVDHRVGSYPTLTHWGARAWTKRRARQVSKQAARQGRDNWLFEA